MYRGAITAGTAAGLRIIIAKAPLFEKGIGG